MKRLGHLQLLIVLVAGDLPSVTLNISNVETGGAKTPDQASHFCNVSAIVRRLPT